MIIGWERDWLPILTLWLGWLHASITIRWCCYCCHQSVLSSYNRLSASELGWYYLLWMISLIRHDWWFVDDHLLNQRQEGQHQAPPRPQPSTGGPHQQIVNVGSHYLSSTSNNLQAIGISCSILVYFINTVQQLHLNSSSCLIVSDPISTIHQTSSQYMTIRRVAD